MKESGKTERNLVKLTRARAAVRRPAFPSGQDAHHQFYMQLVFKYPLWITLMISDRKIVRGSHSILSEKKIFAIKKKKKKKKKKKITFFKVTF